MLSHSVSVVVQFLDYTGITQEYCSFEIIDNLRVFFFNVPFFFLILSSNNADRVCVQVNMQI